MSSASPWISATLTPKLIPPTFWVSDRACYMKWSLRTRLQQQGAFMLLCASFLTLFSVAKPGNHIQMGFQRTLSKVSSDTSRDIWV